VSAFPAGMFEKPVTSVLKELLGLPAIVLPVIMLCTGDKVNHGL
jgi:hypothetical protein